MSTLFVTKVMKINKITPGKHKYFEVLDTIPKPPKNIFFIGNTPVTRVPTVAIVGTRKPTSYGKEVTHMLAYDLAKYGVIIVSGLALGIDGIAHRAALEANGTTIAVLANSVDDIYPKSHQQLADHIVANGGAIISEYEPPTTPRAYQFLARNRIVSGLSDAVIITEAAIRSGTLSTATHALEQGREVFIVPGNITSPLSAGCNALLRQGAHPATCAQDILDTIAPQLSPAIQIVPLGKTPLETTIISLIQSGIRDGDELHAKSQVAITQFNQALTMLEINGSIRPLGANQWSLR
jgi:DNA processing protein